MLSIIRLAVMEATKPLRFRQSPGSLQRFSVNDRPLPVSTSILIREAPRRIWTTDPQGPVP